MARLSVRISRELMSALRRRAEESNLTLSAYVRLVLANGAIATDSDWLLIAWRIFGVNLVRLDTALHKSRSVGEFLAYLDQWSKKVTVTPNPSEKIDFDFVMGEKQYNVCMERGSNFEEDVKAIILELDRKILESFEEEI